MTGLRRDKTTHKFLKCRYRKNKIFYYIQVIYLNIYDVIHIYYIYVKNETKINEMNNCIINKLIFLDYLVFFKTI